MSTVSEANLFVRVDDRLIHGQVVTSWVKALSTRVIWVVSDRARAEPIEIVLLKSSVPHHLKLDVFSIQEAVLEWKRSPWDHLLILFESLNDVVDAYDLSLPVRSVNLGGLRYRPGHLALTKTVYVGEREIAALDALKNREIETTIQILPHDKQVSAYEALKIKRP